MINSLDQFREVGRAAGKAARLRDHLGSRFQLEYGRRMVANEAAADRPAAQAAIDEGYKSEASLPWAGVSGGLLP